MKEAQCCSVVVRQHCSECRSKQTVILLGIMDPNRIIAEVIGRYYQREQVKRASLDLWTKYNN